MPMICRSPTETEYSTSSLSFTDESVLKQNEKVWIKTNEKTTTTTSAHSGCSMKVFIRKGMKWCLKEKKQCRLDRIQHQTGYVTKTTKLRTNNNNNNTQKENYKHIESDRKSIRNICRKSFSRDSRKVHFISEPSATTCFFGIVLVMQVSGLLKKN